MEVFEAIKNRRSVRAYKSTPVQEEKLKKILEAARLAPSAHNAQDWKFIVVKNQKMREKLVKAALDQEFIAQAPVVIVAVATEPGVPFYALNFGIAVEHMVLQAVEEGLGTCWVGAFSQKEVKKILKIPEKYKAMVLLPLGYPADLPKKKIRKNIEEIVCYEKYQ